MQSDNKKNIQVSVVLPTYNRAYILGRAIESVLDQTYKDFELIVVDDGSTDNTKEVVQKFIDGDPRVRYIRHDKNKRLAAGRNTGARAARGKYIANQDSDDIWLPGKLEREVVAFEKSDNKSLGVVYSRMEKTTRDKTTIFVPKDNFSPTSGNLHKKMLEGNFITMQASLMKKECFSKVGGFDESEGLRLEDWDFWLRVSKHYDFLYVPEVGVKVAILGDSLTQHKINRQVAREMIFNKYITDFKKYPKILAKMAHTIGYGYAFLGDMKKARKYLSLAARTRPLNVKYTLAFLLALLNSPKIYKKSSQYYASMS